MRKIRRIKGEDKLKSSNKSSVLVFEDPGAAAAYAAQEAYAAGVSPSAVMHTAPDGAGNGDDVPAPSEAPPEAPVVPEATLEPLKHSGPPEATKEASPGVVNPEEKLKGKVKTPEDGREVTTPEVEVETPAEPDVETKSPDDDSLRSELADDSED